MIFGDILVALAAAFILTVVFSYSMGRTGPWPGLILFFIFIFLASWTGGVWVGIGGPAYRPVYWLPFFIVGLIIAMVVAWVTPRKYLASAAPEQAPAASTQPASSPYLDIFAWLLIGLLIVLIIIGYAAR